MKKVIEDIICSLVEKIPKKINLIAAVISRKSSQ